MMNKQSLALCLSAFLLVTFSFYACKKDSKADSDTTSAQDNSYSEGTYNDVNTMVDASATTGTSTSFRMATNNDGARLEGPFGGCGTVTVDTTSATRTITINFGTANCLCLDGRYRRGKVIATWTGTRYRDSGTVINITFDGYYVDDNQIKGTHKTTNMGRNTAGHLVYKVEVAGQIVKANNGGTITWNSTRQREWLEGAATPLNPLDDVYSITGSASGTTAAGESYTINITQALIRKLTCQWFESGKVDITPSGKATRTLDYGSTGCDANATVTISGVTFPIVLK